MRKVLQAGWDAGGGADSGPRENGQPAGLRAAGNGKPKSGDAGIGETGRYEMEGEKINRKKRRRKGVRR